MNIILLKFYGTCRPVVGSAGTVRKQAESKLFTGHYKIRPKRLTEDMVIHQPYNVLIYFVNLSFLYLLWLILNKYIPCLPDSFVVLYLKRSAVATAHCSQENTVEHSMAMEWRLLQEKSERWWKQLHEVTWTINSAKRVWSWYINQAIAVPAFQDSLL